MITFKVYYVRDLNFHCRHLAKETTNIIKARTIKYDLERKGFYVWIE